MLSDLRSGGVGADFSSVFRSLVWSESQGMLQRVDVGDGRSRFELLAEHHEHVQCERCGVVTEVPGCLVTDATRRLERLTGFAVSTHRLVFLGLCPNCQ
jgi:Fe2+ or Zn2+ uptake regulation protein